MLEVTFWLAVLSSGIRLGVPTLFAAIGELISERAGVLNLGLEGMMISGAFAAVSVAEVTGSVFLGIVAGAAGGALLGLVMVLVAVRGRGNQIVAGFAITILGIGATAFLHDQWRGSLTGIVPLQRLDVAPLSRIPFVGPLFQQNALFYLCIGMVALVWVLFLKTRIGLEIVAVGQDPHSAHSKGVSVVNLRSFSTIAAAALAGVGGAAISVGVLGNFSPGMTAGRGFVAIAMVIVGRWRPLLTAGVALLFGLAEAFQLRAQNLVDVPVQILAALPWALMLILLVLGGRKIAAPQALARDVALER